MSSLERNDQPQYSDNADRQEALRQAEELIIKYRNGYLPAEDKPPVESHEQLMLEEVFNLRESLAVLQQKAVVRILEYYMQVPVSDDHNTTARQHPIYEVPVEKTMPDQPLLGGIAKFQISRFSPTGHLLYIHTAVPVWVNGEFRNTTTDIALSPVGEWAYHRETPVLPEVDGVKSGISIATRRFNGNSPFIDKIAFEGLR